MRLTDYERAMILKAVKLGLRRCGLVPDTAMRRWGEHGLAEWCAVIADLGARLDAGQIEAADDVLIAVSLGLQRPSGGGRLRRDYAGWWYTAPFLDMAGPYEQRWQAVAVGWALDRCWKLHSEDGAIPKAMARRGFA